MAVLWYFMKDIAVVCLVLLCTVESSLCKHISLAGSLSPTLKRMFSPCTEDRFASLHVEYLWKPNVYIYIYIYVVYLEDKNGGVVTFTMSAGRLE